VLLLAVQNLVLDVRQVVMLHILLEDLRDVGVLILIDEGDPVGSSDAVAFALGVGLVAEYSPLVKGAVESSNNRGFIVSDHVLLLLVDLVSDISLSSLNEDDLVDLIKLLEKDGSGILMPWLKELEQLEHEESILLVIPVVVVMVPWILERSIIVLGDAEESLEALAEVTE
jgi:hypothetical protein